MRKKLSSITSYLSDTISYIIHRKEIPIYYFSKTKNVGDILNPYLIEKISNNKAFLVKSRKKKHILPIGSILHFATNNSIVWGSGIIHPSQVPSRKTLKSMQYKAIRGKLTEKELKKYDVELKNITLGDPAVLMPLFYSPKKPRRRYKVGIVPHFVDASHVTLSEYLNSNDVLLIDVRQDPESFIDQIVLCDYILSSSLHGLILSDAYEIPNAWIRFSDKVVGGNFKFQDYYTTTDKVDGENAEPIFISDQEIIDSILTNPKDFCNVNYYIYDKRELLDSFPRFF